MSITWSHCKPSTWRPMPHSAVGPSVWLTSVTIMVSGDPLSPPLPSPPLPSQLPLHKDSSSYCGSTLVGLECCMFLYAVGIIIPPPKSPNEDLHNEFTQLFTLSRLFFWLLQESCIFNVLFKKKEIWTELWFVVCMYINVCTCMQKWMDPCWFKKKIFVHKMRHLCVFFT